MIRFLALSYVIALTEAAYFGLPAIVGQIAKGLLS